MDHRVQLIVPAAGMGTRLGADRPKALVDLAGKPLLVWTLERFQTMGLLDRCIVPVAPRARADFDNIRCEYFPNVSIDFVDGGAERQDSVFLGIQALDRATTIVIVHDAARPFVPEQSIRASIDAAAEFGAATVAIPSIDTVLVSGQDAFLLDTPDRSTLWACQTPQTFRVSVLLDAHERAKRDNFVGTDDASLVRRAGGAVKLVMGSRLNFKVTTPQDLELARCVIEGGIA
ncbi:MAG: 2-C-methyl-D-erythritol 4-phosphate cytidylyltransferase [Candidatus Hydrogenedentes bacterium]|nr:2-C-methyl-D-erythritol 4-phosphate cytidylyltransferase [Candidatus Hydrogenedentota bacterium]